MAKILFFAPYELIKKTEPVRKLLTGHELTLDTGKYTLEDSVEATQPDLVIIVNSPLVYYSTIMLMRDRGNLRTPFLYLATFNPDYSKPSRWLWYMYYQEKPEKIAQKVRNILAETQDKTLPY